MSWIEFVLIFLLLGVVGALVKRFGRPILQILYAMARLPCHKPRYRPGVAALMPKIMVEPMQHVRCTLWKLHDGPHEATLQSGQAEHWSDGEGD